MRKIMTNSLAQNYSLLGVRDKKPFKHLNIFKLVVVVTRYKKEVTESQICDVIARWLVQAKCRIEREGK
ncbi:hypothetical protein C0J52_19789 [Blattella germanica]|nr:hypothetical protein C0J52_19789 [Blattella germanica]